MKNYKEQSKTPQAGRGGAPAGFTLVELLVAMAVFMIVTGAALSLFSQHQPMFNQQQNLAGLNIAMRNATAQMQVDIANGGAGYYNGVNIPNWPVGVVINNNVVTSTVIRREPVRVTLFTVGLASISHLRWKEMIPEPAGAVVVAVVLT